MYGIDERDHSLKWTDLFSDSFSAVINTVIGVVIRVRRCDEKVEFA